jgi:hypothetical protein
LPVEGFLFFENMNTLSSNITYPITRIHLDELLERSPDWSEIISPIGARL